MTTPPARERSRDWTDGERGGGAEGNGYNSLAGHTTAGASAWGGAGRVRARSGRSQVGCCGVWLDWGPSPRESSLVSWQCGSVRTEVGGGVAICWAGCCWGGGQGGRREGREPGQGRCHFSTRK